MNDFISPRIRSSGAQRKCHLLNDTLLGAAWRRSARAWVVRIIAGVVAVVAQAGLAAPVTAFDASLNGVRYEQKIGFALPLAATVEDETGTSRPLGAFFGRRPVVLWLGYAQCPQLCSIVADATVETLRQLVSSAGDAYDVLFVSIDPNDTSRDLAGLKARDFRRYGRSVSPAAWHYVRGDAASIRPIADAAGFHFSFDPQTKRYAHPSGFVIVTPQGVVSRYFLGIDYTPKDVAAALRRAAEGKTGESVFDLLLVCARGGGLNGRYTRVIWLALDGGVMATLGLLGWGIGSMLRAERRRVSANAKGEVAR